MDEQQPKRLPSNSIGGDDGTGEVIPVDPVQFGEDEEVREGTGKRRVRFNLLREVRKFPERIARDAKFARLPYRASIFDCGICGPSPASSPLFNYIVYFAPLVS